MARAVGRCDWWNVYDEHTPYQWAMQRAAAAVDPWGEDRADQRAAMQTLALVQAQLTKPMPEAGRQALLAMLTEYTDAARKSRLSGGVTMDVVDSVLPG